MLRSLVAAAVLMLVPTAAFAAALEGRVDGLTGMPSAGAASRPPLAADHIPGTIGRQQAEGASPEAPIVLAQYQFRRRPAVRVIRPHVANVAAIQRAGIAAAARQRMAIHAANQRVIAATRQRAAVAAANQRMTAAARRAAIQAAARSVRRVHHFPVQAAHRRLAPVHHAPVHHAPVHHAPAHPPSAGGHGTAVAAAAARVAARAEAERAARERAEEEARVIARSRRKADDVRQTLADVTALEEKRRRQQERDAEEERNRQEKEAARNREHLRQLRVVQLAAEEKARKEKEAAAAAAEKARKELEEDRDRREKEAARNREHLRQLRLAQLASEERALKEKEAAAVAAAVEKANKEGEALAAAWAEKDRKDREAAAAAKADEERKQKEKQPEVETAARDFLKGLRDDASKRAAAATQQEEERKQKEAAVATEQREVQVAARDFLAGLREGQRKPPDTMRALTEADGRQWEALQRQKELAAQKEGREAREEEAAKAFQKDVKDVGYRVDLVQKVVSLSRAAGLDALGDVNRALKVIAAGAKIYETSNSGDGAGQAVAVTKLVVAVAGAAPGVDTVVSVADSAVGVKTAIDKGDYAEAVGKGAELTAKVAAATAVAVPTVVAASGLGPVAVPLVGTATDTAVSVVSGVTTLGREGLDKSRILDPVFQDYKADQRAKITQDQARQSRDRHALRVERDRERQVLDQQRQQIRSILGDRRPAVFEQMDRIPTGTPTMRAR